MDACPPWQPANSGGAPSLLHVDVPDDLLFGLDADTLGSLVVPSTGSGTSAAVTSEGAGAGSGSGRVKRARMAEEAASLSTFLQHLRDSPEQAGDGGSLDAGDDDEPGESRSKGKPLGAAATKACREKRRRERLNEGFAEMSKLIDPGKVVKNDKASLVADAVRVITQLRAENNQLKQLNKFLEEKCTQSEKQKSQLLMQQAMMQQHQGIGMPYGMPAMQQGMQAMQPAMAQQMQAGMTQQMQAGMAQQMPQPVQGMVMGMPTLTSMPSGGMANSSHAVTGQMPGAGVAGGVMQGIATSMACVQVPGQTQDDKPYSAMSMASTGGMDGMVSGPGTWLPQSTLDTSQDHKIRPPAA